MGMIDERFMGALAVAGVVGLSRGGGGSPKLEKMVMAGERKRVGTVGARVRRSFREP